MRIGSLEQVKIQSERTTDPPPNKKENAALLPERNFSNLRVPFHSIRIIVPLPLSVPFRIVIVLSPYHIKLPETFSSYPFKSKIKSFSMASAVLRYALFNRMMVSPLLASAMALSKVS